MIIQRIRDWLAPAAAGLSLAACYGTLAAIALLGVLGVTVALDEAVWAGAIVLFAWLTVLALWPGRRRHGGITPVVLAALGAGTITWTMTVAYERALELAGFACLCLGTFLDWRLVRRQRSGTP